MPLSVAERQAKRRAKLKTKGKFLFQAWVTTHLLDIATDLQG